MRDHMQFASVFTYSCMFSSFNYPNHETRFDWLNESHLQYVLVRVLFSTEQISDVQYSTIISAVQWTVHCTVQCLLCLEQYSAVLWPVQCSAVQWTMHTVQPTVQYSTVQCSMVNSTVQCITVLRTEITTKEVIKSSAVAIVSWFCFITPCSATNTTFSKVVRWQIVFKIANADKNNYICISYHRSIT